MCYSGSYEIINYEEQNNFYAGQREDVTKIGSKFEKIYYYEHNEVMYLYGYYDNIVVAAEYMGNKPKDEFIRLFTKQFGK